MDKQKQIMQGLWRRAGRQEEALEIKCKTLADARRMRFALYNAVREFKPDQKDGRAPKPADPALQHAINNCSVSFKDDDPTTVLLRQKTKTTLMMSALEALGEEPLLDEVDIAAGASASAVMKKLSESGGAGAKVEDGEDGGAGLNLPRTTPYYTR